MKHLIMIIPFMLLTACASQKPVEISPPQEYAPAIEVRDIPGEVRIVEVPKILALPGQLKQLPDKKMIRKNIDPEQAIKQAHQKAMWQPGEGRYFNVIQNYPYTKGALYQLYAAPNHVTDVSLEPGEALKSVSAGDTVRWVIGDTISGSGAMAQVHILVKPIEAGLVTNLVIITDRRSYHLELKSLGQTYMAALNWSYPHSEIRKLKQQNILARADQNSSVSSDLNLDELNFAYAITGDEPDWRPFRAFDDGKKVYIEFPRDIATGEAPPLFVLGPKDQVELVNYRMRGRYYVVDRLFRAAELRLGEDPQQKVRIFRKTGKQKRGRK